MARAALGAGLGRRSRRPLVVRLVGPARAGKTTLLMRTLPLLPRCRTAVIQANDAGTAPEGAAPHVRLVAAPEAHWRKGLVENVRRLEDAELVLVEDRDGPPVLGAGLGEDLQVLVVPAGDAARLAPETLRQARALVMTTHGAPPPAAHLDALRAAHPHHEVIGTDLAADDAGLQRWRTGSRRRCCRAGTDPRRGDAARAATVRVRRGRVQPFDDNPRTLNPDGGDMTMGSGRPDPRPEAAGVPPEGLARTVCGVDASRQSFEAVRQAALLTAPDGRLTIVAAHDFIDVLGLRHRMGLDVGAAAPDLGDKEVAAELRRRTEDLLARAAAQAGRVGTVETRQVAGRAGDALTDAARDTGAELIAVGAHEERRLVGVALGNTATLLTHSAPCSVLVARPPYDPAAFPSRIAVGLDGSEGSGAALRMARRLAVARGAALEAVVAGDDDPDDRERALAQAGDVPVVARAGRPVDCLLEAAEEVDLLVLGQRGLRGARALGSVSERVAHRAECSVLVVRDGAGRGAA